VIPDSDEDADADAVTDDEAIFSKPNHSDRERESRHCETRFKSVKKWWKRRRFEVWASIIRFGISRPKLLHLIDLGQFGPPGFYGFGYWAWELMGSVEIFRWNFSGLLL
jgi:hypothetical protein